MLLRTDAKGVTPVPAPTSKTVSNLKILSSALPNGPSMKTRGKSFRSAEGASLASVSILRPTTADESLLAPGSVKRHPIEAPMALDVVSTHGTWIER